MLWFTILLFATDFSSAKPPSSLFKRATSEQHIQDVFSRFTKRSKGWASYYGEYPVGTGACSLDPLPPVYKQKGWIKVAAGAPDYQKSLGCGMCLKIEASGKPVAKGNKPLKGTYYAVINDLCGACGQGDLDFYIEGDGKWDISFDAIDCPDVSGASGNIQYRFTGSNPWYIKLQITNSKQPTAAVEFFKDGKWHCAKRTDDNHFVWSGVGKIDFPLRTRITSITGETVGGNIPKLSNDKDQDSGFQYKKFKDVSKGAAPKLPCHGQGGLVRDGKATDVTSQGQKATTDGTDGGSQPTTAPKTTPNPEKETKPGTENGGTTEGNSTNGGLENGTKPETGGESTNIEDFCKTKPSGTYGDPTDCEYFIQCANSKTFRKKCPSGLHWNDKIKNCDYPASAGCSKQKGKGKSAQSFVDPEFSVDAEKEQTRPGKERGNEEQTEHSMSARCPDIIKGVGRYHYPEDCSKFIMCNGTNAKIYRCPDGYLYDQYLNKCRKENYVDCGKDMLQFPSRNTNSAHSYDPEVQNQSGESSEKIIEVANSNGSPIDTNFCLGKMDGEYRMVNDCQGFYKCSRGLTKLKKCPEGLLFNASKEVCDWPKSVQC